MTDINWPELLQAGLGRLRLAPDRFWALTPAELILMLGTGAGAAPLTRDRLEALAAAFPDNTRDDR